MGKYTTALIIALSINVMLMIAQISINELNPDVNDMFFDYSKSSIGQYDEGGFILDTSKGRELPEGSQSSGGFFDELKQAFTDIFESIKGWLSNSFIGKTTIGVVTAVPNYLKIVFPNDIAFILGTFWHILTGFLLVQAMFGRD